MFNPLMLVEWRKLSGRFTVAAWVVALALAFALVMAEAARQSAPTRGSTRAAHHAIIGR
jgi:hypothetical protein